MTLKNRQSIDTNSHQDHTEDVEKDQSELEHQDTIENTEQQFPPRNAQRRKRRRDLATNHNKQVHNESQTSEDNVQNEVGTIDDRQVESSHSTESQEPSHQDSTPQHEEEYYNKNALQWINHIQNQSKTMINTRLLKMQKITLSIQQFLIRVKLNNLSNLNHILQQVLTNQKHQK